MTPIPVLLEEARKLNGTLSVPQGTDPPEVMREKMRQDTLKLATALAEAEHRGYTEAMIAVHRMLDRAGAA